MTENVTLSDVARAAGVSLATASRAVNGNLGRGGRSADHKRIAKIAAELGYVPDAGAQAIARGRSTVLGLVVSDISDLALTNTLYDVVSTTADANGLSPSMTSAAGAPELLAARVRDMHRQRARSLVVAAVDGHNASAAPGLRAALDAFTRSGGTAATLGFAVNGTSSVTIDEEGGARSVAAMLHSVGYRRPVLIHGSSSDPIHDARRRGFVAEFSDRGIVVQGGPGDGDEYAATRRMLTSTSTRPDVIVCISSRETDRVIDAVMDEGLRVPADVALAVCGDGPTTTRGLSMTCAATPWRRAAEMAASYAMAPHPTSISTASVVLAQNPILGLSSPGFSI